MTNENNDSKVRSTNIQISTLIRALMESEPCLFHNKPENLMSNSSSGIETLYPFRGEHPPVVKR